MKTIRLFIFFLAIASGVAAQNTDTLSYHNSHQLSDTSYSLVKANGDSTIFLFEGGNSSGSNYRTMSLNADSTQVIWQGGSQPADTLEIWGTGVTADSGTTVGSGANYHLPYNGNSADYLGGDTTFHALPDIYKKAGTDSIFKVINGATIWVTNSVNVSKPYVWTGSQTFANGFNAIGPSGSANSTLRINGYGGSDNSNWGTTWQTLSSGTDINLGVYTPHAYIHLGQWGGVNFQKVSEPLVGGDLGFDQITMTLGLAPEPGAILDVQSWSNHRSLPPFRFRYSNSDQWRDTVVSGALEPYKDSLYFTGQNLIRKRLAFADEPATPKITSGASAPSTAPAKVGDIYVDITNKKLYFAAGNSSSADWIIAN
jgi:hypothetical protein